MSQVTAVGLDAGRVGTPCARAGSELVLDGEAEDGGDDGDEGVGAIVIIVGEEEVPTDDG